MNDQKNRVFAASRLTTFERAQEEYFFTFEQYKVHPAEASSSSTVICATEGEALFMTRSPCRQSFPEMCAIYWSFGAVASIYVTVRLVRTSATL